MDKKSLSESYAQFAAFDALAASDEAISQGAAKMECTKPGHWVGDTEWFDDGAEWENSRRSAVDKALKGLIEACDEMVTAANASKREMEVTNGASGYTRTINYGAVEDALAELRKELERGE